MDLHPPPAPEAPTRKRGRLQRRKHTSPADLHLLGCVDGQVLEVWPGSPIHVEDGAQVVILLRCLAANTLVADPMSSVNRIVRLPHGVIAAPSGDGARWHARETAATEGTQVAPDGDVGLSEVFGKLEAVGIVRISCEIHNACPDAASAARLCGLCPEAQATVVEAPKHTMLENAMFGIPFAPLEGLQRASRVVAAILQSDARKPPQLRDRCEP